VHLDRYENYAVALRYFEEALKHNVQCFGYGLAVASTFNNIGLVHRQLGNFQKALEYHEKSLEIKILFLGVHHPSVADTFYNFGVVARNLENFQKALEYYYKALEINLKCSAVLAWPTPSTTLHGYTGNEERTLKQKLYLKRLLKFMRHYTDRLMEQLSMH
jgi:tetratricopeptide (TPR) repeat protein